MFAGLAALAVAGYTAHYAGRAAGALAGVTLALLSGTPVLAGRRSQHRAVRDRADGGRVVLRDPRLERARRAAAGALTAAAVLMNIAFAVVVPFVAWELWRARAAGAARGRCSSRRRAPPPWRCRSWCGSLAAGALDDFAAQVLGQAGDDRHRQRAVGLGPERGRGRAERRRACTSCSPCRAGGLWVAGLLGCAIAAQDARVRPGAVAARLWIVLAWLRVKLAVLRVRRTSTTPRSPAIAVGLALGVAALWQPPPRGAPRWRRSCSCWRRGRT